MAYLDVLKGLTAGGPPGASAGGPNGGAMTPPPATQGLGPPPAMPGLPPPPTGAGAIPTGAPAKTLQTAGADAISGLRDLQGFVPSMYNEINEMISKIKAASTPKKGENPGPAIGEPGTPGTLQLDGSQLMDSGSPGPY